MPKTARFDKVKVLTGDTRILGASAEEWDRALTGNMQQTLQHVKRLVDSGVTRDLTRDVVRDVASTVAARLRNTKLP